MDFSTPVKQVSYFFMYLNLNRRPSTIDGYRTAFRPSRYSYLSKLGPYRLLSSCHRDRPKSSRNLPKWNLSTVLGELTKPPFEPTKDTDLKHLALKTAFLLALASRKHCSEIHGWVANNMSNLGQWEKAVLFSFFRFYSQKPFSKRRFSKCVSSDYSCYRATTIVDRQFKEDRTLCLVRAPRYYLDRTKDLRSSRSLLFISFKIIYFSDIRAATLSSWLK